MKLLPLLLCIILTAGLNTTAQTPQHPDAASTNQVSASTQTGSAEAAPASGTAHAASQAVTSLPPIAIIVIDTSGTVRLELPTLKKVAQTIMASVPDHSRFGIVTVDTEAQKNMFQRREEASAYVESLATARGGYTDLNRATDSALALVQREGASRPTVIVYLTDGKLEVPPQFRDRSDFTTVLKREFTPRPQIRVVVVNVNGGEMPQGADALPPNVTRIPLKNWSAALTEVTNTLAPQIGQQLAPPPVVAPSPPPPAPETSSLVRALIWGGVILALAVAAGFALLRKRRKGAQAGPDFGRTEKPDNLLTEADLKPVPEPEPEPVVIIETEKSVEYGSHHRVKIEIGERVVIGKTPVAADITLPGLSQTQTLELRFDKEGGTPTLKAFRLRPDVRGQLDAVLLNERETAPIFILHHRDRLSVGETVFRVIFTERKFLPLLGDPGRAGEVETAPPEPLELSPTEVANGVHSTVREASSLFNSETHVSLRRRAGSARHPS